jgi:hypothetical protein
MNSEIMGSDINSLPSGNQSQYQSFSELDQNIGHSYDVNQPRMMPLNPIPSMRPYTDPAMQQQMPMEQQMQMPMEQQPQMQPQMEQEQPLEVEQQIEMDYPDKELKNKSLTGISNYVPEDLISPIVIIVLFIILSNPLIQNFIGKYIPQTNPDSNGVVSLMGVSIYGILMAALFVVVKKLV